MGLFTALSGLFVRRKIQALISDLRVEDLRQRVVEAEAKERERDFGRVDFDDRRFTIDDLYAGVYDGQLRGAMERRVRPPDLHAPVLSFSARLLTYVNGMYGGKASMVYKRAKVSRQSYARIVSSNDSKVDKDTALRFCVGLRLDMFESELLMKAAGYAFSMTDPKDIVFVFCIENKVWDVKDVNALLKYCYLPTLR